MGDTFGVFPLESPCSEFCSWDLSEIGDNTWTNLDEDRMLDLCVRNSRVGFARPLIPRPEAAVKGMERSELLCELMEHPAPDSDELTRLWTLSELELLTDSMELMADEQDSLSPLKLWKNFEVGPLTKSILEDTLGFLDDARTAPDCSDVGKESNLWRMLLLLDEF